MPEKSWEVVLENGILMLVERHTRRGVVIRFRVVLLADIDGVRHCVTRYDTSHGFPHRDVLGFGEKQLDKEGMKVNNLNEAFEIAYRDIIVNYEYYLDFYKTH